MISIQEKRCIPGEHRLILSGGAGLLEAVLTVPENSNPRYLAFIGHPHSLQGGTMNNKVVTTLVRAFQTQHIPSLRFNFRGVGQSQGEYDAGIGESEDMLRLVRACLQEQPDLILIFAGFSFGSYVAYRAAAQCSHALLITIAPAIPHYDFTEFSPAPSPWVMLIGDEDDIVPIDVVTDFIAQASPAIPLHRFPGVGHFFHGKLLELRQCLIDILQDYTGGECV